MRKRGAIKPSMRTASLIFISAAVLLAASYWGCFSSDPKPEINNLEEVEIAWSTPHGSRPTSPTDFAAICKDRSGSIYVVVSDRDSMAFFMKYDSNGKRIWFTREQFLPAAILNDFVGHVYIAGSKVDKNAGFSGSVVTKYKDSGEKVWSAASSRYQQGFDKTCSLAVDGWGNILLTGVEFEKGHSFTTIKYDKNGIQKWSVSHEGLGQQLTSIATAVDGEGSIYVTGDRGLNKINKEGRPIWSSKIGGSGIVLDRHVAVYVCGYQSEKSGYVTTKFSAAGKQQWSNTYPTQEATELMHLELDNEGNLFVCGYRACLKYSETGERLFEKPGGKYMTLDPQGNFYTTIDHKYCTTIKYDGRGKKIWSTNFEKPKQGYNRPYALMTNTAGDLFLTLVTEGLYRTVKYVSKYREDSE